MPSKGRRTDSKKPKDRNNKEKDWEQWGEEFGKRMQQMGDEFGQAMEKWGREFGQRKERKIEARREWTFGLGFLGPLVGAVFGIIILAIGIAFLNWINISISSVFISGITRFLSNNIQWFFLAGLVFGYGDYAVRKNEDMKFLRPLLIALKVLFAIWVILGIFGAF